MCGWVCEPSPMWYLEFEWAVIAEKNDLSLGFLLAIRHENFFCKYNQWNIVIIMKTALPRVYIQLWWFYVQNVSNNSRNITRLKNLALYIRETRPLIYFWGKTNKLPVKFTSRIYNGFNRLMNAWTWPDILTRKQWEDEKGWVAVSRILQGAK